MTKEEEFIEKHFDASRRLDSIETDLSNLIFEKIQEDRKINKAIAEHEATDEDIYNEIENQISIHGKDNVRVIAQNVANFVKKGKKP